ncbi:urease accessory protein F-like [Bidens hawaiensis]|uniref:urease accessory protein F-like n=1 Tax=Bidens hawaiensis TaxID=980011 RepID=UPI004049AAE0
MDMTDRLSSPESDSLLQWSKWQLVDSILPTGGFAHSFGLESAMQAHIVANPEHLQSYIIHTLDNTGSLLLPFVYSAATSPDYQTLQHLDTILNATLTNETARKASISQGSALMRISSSIFSEIPLLKTIRTACLNNGDVCFHHAPVFGLVCGLVGLDSETCQRAFMFVTVRDIISAATRLNLVGPLAAAVLQHRVSFVAEELLKKWKNRGVDEACQTSPLLDTVQGCHSYLFSRLFCS